MRLGGVLAIGIPLLIAGAAGAAHLTYRNAMAKAERAMRGIEPAPSAGTFDAAIVADQPEIAQRYFAHAIAPGTPLASVVELEMRGTFLLGDKDKHQRYAMNARQVLRPPFEFVWMPVLKSGPMTITGSDALADGRAWTRFWINGLVPVANVGSSPDLVRSASFRAATEGIWVPASLLPQNGVKWEQTGKDRARVTVTAVKPAIILDLTLSSDGAVREIVGQRWSNANAGKEFRLQPFGGTVEAEASFGGYTIPSRVSVGNHYGTGDYLPFFQAEIVRASFR